MAQQQKKTRKTQKKRNMADLRGLETVYITPPEILDPTRRYCDGSIPLDPATLPSNPTRADHYCIERPAPVDALSEVGMVHIDGLQHPWHEHPVTFVNPPYSGGVMKTWASKIYYEAVMGATIIALLPCGARFSTRYWQDHILSDALDAMTYIRGRVRFHRPDGSPTQGSNPYDSLLYGYNVDYALWVECFGELGSTSPFCLA